MSTAAVVALDLIWGYAPSPHDRAVTDEWIGAHDISDIEVIAIGEAAIAITTFEIAGRRVATTGRVKRHQDLAADLSGALKLARE